MASLFFITFFIVCTKTTNNIDRETNARHSPKAEVTAWSDLKVKLFHSVKTWVHFNHFMKPCSAIIQRLLLHWGIEFKLSFSLRVILGIRFRWSSTQLPTHLSISARTAGSFAPESNRSLALSLQCIVHLVRRSCR